MEIFNKRYFIWMAFAFLAFSVIALLIDVLYVAMSVCAFLIILLTVCIFAGKKNKGSLFIAALILIFALIGSANSAIYNARMRGISEKYSGEHYVRGYVTDVSHNAPYRSEYTVIIEIADGHEASFSAILITDFDAGLSCGDFFETRASGEDFNAYKENNFLTNVYASDYALVLVADKDSEVILTEPEFRIRLILNDLKTEMSDLLEDNIGGGVGEMASALLLGNRNLLSDEILRDFRRAGCYHMLALSGMHVSIIVAIFEFFLKRLFVPKGVRIALLSAILIFYVALTGFLPSACRAMLMLWIYYIATCVGRISDSLVALFGAVSLIVLISPASALDIGLLLSFISTFGIIVASLIRNKVDFFTREIKGGKIRKRAVTFLRNTVFMLMSTVCVCVASLPVLHAFFGELSLATFFTNLFIGFFAEILLGLSLVAVLLHYVGIPFGAICDLAELTGRFMSDAVAVISDIPNVVLSLNYPGAPIFVWGLFAAALALLTVKVRKKRTLILLPLVFVLMTSVSLFGLFLSRADSVVGEFVSSDRGDLFCLSSNGGVYICDMSDGSYSALYLATNIAKENCFSEIEGVVITHYHKDHAASVRKLCERQKVRRVYMPIPQNESEYYICRAIASEIEENKTEIILYEREAPLDVLGGELFVSRSVYSDGRAHPSYALSYAYGDNRATVLENPYFSTYLEENEELNRYISESELLIVGSDGNAVKESFSIAHKCTDSQEICFAQGETAVYSDLDLSSNKVYIDVEYKKYRLGE